MLGHAVEQNASGKRIDNTEQTNTWNNCRFINITAARQASEAPPCRPASFFNPVALSGNKIMNQWQDCAVKRHVRGGRKIPNHERPELSAILAKPGPGNLDRLLPLMGARHREGLIFTLMPQEQLNVALALMEYTRVLAKNQQRLLYDRISYIIDSWSPYAVIHVPYGRKQLQGIALRQFCALYLPLMPKDCYPKIYDHTLRRLAGLAPVYHNEIALKLARLFCRLPHMSRYGSNLDFFKRILRSCDNNPPPGGSPALMILAKNIAFLPDNALPEAINMIMGAIRRSVPKHRQSDIYRIIAECMDIKSLPYNVSPYNVSALASLFFSIKMY